MRLVNLGRTRIHRNRLTIRKVAQPFVLVVAIGLTIVAFYTVIINSSWNFIDWSATFHPAASSPSDPYGARDPLYLANPPWLFWLLFPFGLISWQPALAAWSVLTIIVSAWCIFRLSGDRLVVLLSLTSPAFARVFIQGQIEVIPLLGFTLALSSSGQISRLAGYVLILVKPQVLGLGPVIAWFKLGWRDKILVTVAILAVFGVSFLIYGNWVAAVYSNAKAIVNSERGIRLWPYGIPIGIILLALSTKRRDVKLGALSTIFFVPYIDLHSLFPYIAVLFTMIPRFYAFALYVALWFVALLLT